ncbi:class I SAM-dependent methyltransferase [Bosea sp. 2RAB26]|uniref:class I SAM-dependent methyltransferase n=1 Tax=Bosea sp. 2RAB26 TaxID=3237476 RepID=UPI003F8E5365
MHGLDVAPEWDALRRLLPELRGKRVLDLGCGFGWFCRWTAGQGAASVLGVELSERMLARAHAETRDPAVSYLKSDLEQFSPEAEALDLAYSSLAFHYLTGLESWLARVHAALAPGGVLVCSVEHPIMTAPRHQDWSSDASGLPTWPVGAYLDEGPRRTNWLAEGIIKQHRTIGTYLQLLLAAGFILTHLEEWGGRSGSGWRTSGVGEGARTSALPADRLAASPQHPEVDESARIKSAWLTCRSVVRGLMTARGSLSPAPRIFQDVRIGRGPKPR